MIYETVVLLCICALTLSGAMLYAIIEKIKYFKAVLDTLHALS